MQPGQLAKLLSHRVDGLAETLDLIAGLDDFLAHGLARPDARRATVLNGLSQALAATPLGEPVNSAVEKLTAGVVSDAEVTVLAGARTALFGAVHDALAAGFDTATGRTREESGEIATSPVESTASTGVAGARSWLTDLAIGGWTGVDHDLVSAVGKPVETLLSEPDTRRLGVLLDGLSAELRGSSPVATMTDPPIRRWSDLWARALMLTAGQRHPAEADSVSGRLLPLGCEILEHGNVVQVRVHGLLESSAAPRLLRATVAAAKVDTIVGPAVWRLLAAHQNLLTALAEHRALELTAMPLLPGGDLRWQDDAAKPGDEVDPFATARLLLSGAVTAAAPPLERHPVRLAEPVLLEGYQVGEDESGAVTFEWGDTVLRVAMDRLSACSPLTAKPVTGSAACIGLLRWDGEWSVQPLAVLARRKGTAVHVGDWALGPTDAKAKKAEAKAADAVTVLRERAGRLLRK